MDLDRTAAFWRRVRGGGFVAIDFRRAYLKDWLQDAGIEPSTLRDRDVSIGTFGDQGGGHSGSRVPSLRFGAPDERAG
jgi:hypothetical protein